LIPIASIDIKEAIGINSLEELEFAEGVMVGKI